MSRQSFDREYTKPLLRRLKQEKRLAVEAQKGQVLILEDLKDFQAVITKTFPGREIPKAALETALTAGRARASELQNSYKSKNKRRFNKIVKKIATIPEFNKYTLGQDLFVLAAFSTANLVKNSILKAFEEEGVLTDTETSQVKGKLHRGHGVEGAAVSQVEIASAITSLPKKDREVFLGNLDSYMRTNNTSINASAIIEGISGTYDQIVTAKGNLRADYFSVITFQEGTENLVDSVDEKAAKTVFRKFVEEEMSKELLNLRGSSTLKEKIETVIVDAAFSDAGKLPNMKVTRNKKADLKTQGKGSKPKKKKSNTRVNASRRGRFKGPIKGSGSAMPSVLTMLGTLNQQLPSTLAKNMQSPALNYQTGRFASSVRVTDIIFTPKGFPSIGYTYQKNPYQTFEPGYAQGTVERDPRKLIDRALREIMVQFAIGRFYTRRA